MDPACLPVKLAFSLLFVALLGCGESITVRDAWIREPPPHSPAAGYLIIENRSARSVELVGVETVAAERTEIHVMEHRDGKMTMRITDAVTVPADGQVALLSGGTHLMLMGLRRELKAGDEVALVLRFADDTVKRVVAPVRKGGYAPR